jgi:hypothetical protein
MPYAGSPVSENLANANLGEFSQREVELLRIHILGTSVKVDKRKGRGHYAPALSATDASRLP